MYEDSWVGGAAASGVAASFGKLAAAAAPPTNAPVGNALEELVREMLRPLMKAWLDENLPAIVQARVDEEVERIARGETR
jgi:cell pole-organizing protein PopZ